MRIDPKVPIRPITTESRDATGKPEGRAAAPGSEAAVVQLSSAGARAAESTSGPGATGMTQRLTSIKAMIDGGTYPIDLDKLAERIVDDEMVRARRLTDE